MIPMMLLARRSRSPAFAVIKLAGICILLFEMMFMIDEWHPWPERGTSIRARYYDGVEWIDGSIIGCATVYQNYPPSSWHLDIYFGKAWFYRPRSSDFYTRAEAIQAANKRCRP